MKNPTLVKNMQHVKWKEIPPLKGPNPQGLRKDLKQDTKKPEKLNGRQSNSYISAEYYTR